MTGPIKADLDQRMERTLKAMARRRGEDHETVTLPHWVNHDLRRTIRTGLSALRIPHQRRRGRACASSGRHRRNLRLSMNIADEKREALEAWAQRIASIVNPGPAAPAKVVKLRRRR